MLSAIFFYGFVTCIIGHHGNGCNGTRVIIVLFDVLHTGEYNKTLAGLQALFDGRDGEI